MQEIWQNMQVLIITYGLRILGALLILVLGRWAAGFFSRLTAKLMRQAKMDTTLTRFAQSIVNVGILVFAILAALNAVGIQNTSIVAFVGAAGLAIGLALEGALANFAAGALILVFRPFKVGQLVEVAGIFGYVEEIQIFNTVVVTLDNKTVIVPNGQVTGGPITNYSQRGVIRLDMIFGIGYSDDLRKAQNILQDILENEPLVVKEPRSTVAVMELADSSVNFAVRPYVKPDDYWPAHFAITKQVKLRFDAEGISIPFPQRDVHLFSQN
ncbi:MAG: mechanosensitive ion channel [Anaerolineales bacterium]|nr:mechanosensitive ion channel [Anaerolineales bacterium]MCB8952176.1 mechanosensitive ion channel [Ardenticatenales bacterium]